MITVNKMDVTKAYKCKVCPYMTRFKSNLLKHIRVHTGEKPFACQYCGKRFSSRSNHKNHEERHAEQGQQYLRCPYENCQFQAPEAEVMQEHLVGKHPYGKLRIFRGADGSAVIREKGAYGNHMVEVGNMTTEVEVASLGTEINTSKNAVNALNATGFGLGSAANQLNQAAQLATGLSLWNMAASMPVVSMNSVAGIMPQQGSIASIAQQLNNKNSQNAHHQQQQQENVINIAPTLDEVAETEVVLPSREKLLSMSPEQVLGLIKSGRFPANYSKKNELHIKEEDTTFESNGYGHTTDSETTTTDESPMSQVNGSATPSPAPPAVNGSATASSAGTTNRRFNRRKAAAPAHIRQRLSGYQVHQQNGDQHGSGEIVDKLVDEGSLYRCDACNILFPEYSVYVLHLGCHGSGDAFECHFCKIVFDDKFGFLTHFTKCVKSDLHSLNDNVE